MWPMFKMVHNHNGVLRDFGTVALCLRRCMITKVLIGFCTLAIYVIGGAWSQSGPCRFLHRGHILKMVHNHNRVLSGRILKVVTGTMRS